MHKENGITSNCEPSGHSCQRPIQSFQIHPTSFARGSATDYVKQFGNYSGPYKDHNPPGNRTPAVGEKIWGDHPYLPSYLDPMYTEASPTALPDNLHCRGPFYKGVSETHTEYVNRGVLPRRQRNEYVRHYEEPGLKFEESVTHADFQPPLPVLPSDRAPCLMEDSEKPWFKPEPKELKNPHAKELEYRPVETQVVYIDEAYKRDFSTEHNDNYVCFHEEKKGSKIQDISPVPEEIFIQNIREAHQNCTHPPVSAEARDDSCEVRQHCPGPTPKKISWLLQPKNHTFQNGVMLIPCKCRNAKLCNRCR